VRRRAIGGDELGEAGEASEIRLLREHADGEAWLQEASSLVEIHESGEDIQNRRFARSVRSHESHPFTTADGELDPGKERATAKGDRGAADRGYGGSGSHVKGPESKLDLLSFRLSPFFEDKADKRAPREVSLCPVPCRYDRRRH
jgi:hypothetical protein